MTFPLQTGSIIAADHRIGGRSLRYDAVIPQRPSFVRSIQKSRLRDDPQ
jgi:hypothetical protein